MDMSMAAWRTSSYSGGNGAQCVEVADNLHDVVAVRDSKNPSGPVLTFTHNEWHTFIADLKAHS
ncbi:DUF397 domain-containing protein [Thermopolyspora sp. NPDC052614]|uniref:DUF397 domain-containing protein n=1 Tax=Thermopolyspora sp. NPDC052614 TaxID=3155682 RepID=UPI00344136B4